MVRSEQDLIMKVAALKRCAPREFDEAVAALKEHSAEQGRLCVSSPPDQLHRMQGRAQQCAELTSLFEDAVKTADRIAAKSGGTSAAVQRR